MTKNSFLHKIIYRFGVWITPIVLILTSIFINLPNSNLHKKTLRNSDFYSNLSQEITRDNLKPTDINKGFSSILFAAVLSDIANPGWLQNFFEENIDLITTWLTDNKQTSDLILYIPAQEIEIAIANKINEKTAKASKDFGDQIPTCKPEEETKIKREGFNLDQNLCLPESVKSGKQTLLQFLNIDENNVERSDVLNKLINNNVLNNFNENFRANQILSLTPAQRNFFNFMNNLRRVFLWLGRLLPFLLLACLILLVIDLFLAKNLEHKKLSYEIRRYFYAVAIGTISTSVLIILIMGGFIYLNSWIQSILIPGLENSTVTTLFAIEGVKFAFNIISLAVWISIGLIVFNLILKFLEVSGFLSDVKKKNEKLQKRISSIDKNPTLDGEFQRLRQEQDQNIKGRVSDTLENSNSVNNFFEKSPEMKRMQGSSEDFERERLNQFGNYDRKIGSILDQEKDDFLHPNLNQNQNFESQDDNEKYRNIFENEEKIEETKPTSTQNLNREMPFNSFYQDEFEQKSDNSEGKIER